MLAGALALVATASAAGLFLTEAPTAVAALVAPAVLAWGGALARREWRRAPESLVLRADGSALVGGGAVEGFSIAWQGPLTTLAWTAAGRRRRRVAWPDVIDASMRRELRLWTLGRAFRASTAAVAP